VTFDDIAKKKVAGVPVLYIAGAFVVILAVVAYKMKSTPSGDNGPVDETQGEASDVTGGAADYSGQVGSGTVIVAPQNAELPEAVKETNESWERTAVAYLIDSNIATPSDAQLAIDHYLQGADLTFEQGKLKDAAIKKLGLPPEPLPGVGSISAQPAQKQFNSFPGKHTVKGVNDNTAAKLAALYYGNGDASHAARIGALNAKLGPVGTTYNAGTVIYIPVWTNPRYYTITSTTRYPQQVSSKNGISYDTFIYFNPGLTAPYKVGSKVRVG